MKCFACGRKTPNPAIADTRDGQFVLVGTECLKKIKRAADGWQPPKGGPKLYPLRSGLTIRQIGDIRDGKLSELSHP